MVDQDKTDKVIPLVDLLNEKEGPTGLLPELRFTEDETLATAGVFKRFAMWLMGQKRRR